MRFGGFGFGWTIKQFKIYACLPEDTIRVVACFTRKNSFWSYVMPAVMDDLVTKPK